MKMFSLLLKKWNILQELIVILQVPYKATIALQNPRITLSDAFSIWVKIDIHLKTLSKKKSYKTNLAKHLLDSYLIRKEKIFNNPAMVCALYLDPRFRIEIIRNEDKRNQAKSMLLNIWRRLNIICPIEMQESSKNQPIVPDNQMENCLCVSGESNISIDFDDPTILDNYLSTSTHNSEAHLLQSNDLNDIELEIDLFDPPQSITDINILSYWEAMKDSNKNLYKLASVVFAIPPTEVQIERDFSQLEYIFNNRRCNLTPDLVDDILLIHLNKDLFFIIEREELYRLQFPE